MGATIKSIQDWQEVQGSFLSASIMGGQSGSGQNTEKGWAGRARFEKMINNTSTEIRQIKRKHLSSLGPVQSGPRHRGENLMINKNMISFQTFDWN